MRARALGLAVDLAVDLALVLALVAATACGGSSAKEATTPPVVAPEPPPVAEEPADEPSDEITVEGTMGSVDPARVGSAIESRGAEIDRCYKAGLKGTRYVGGTVELEVKIDATGTVTSARVAAGDLGSWPVEKCLLALVRGVNLGKPTGGPIAVTRFPLERQGRGKLEDAADDQTQLAIDDKHWKTLGDCEGPHAGAQIVLYVAPNGHVTSAGFVATAEPLDEAWADCAHEVIRDWRLPAPRGKVLRHRISVP